MKETVIIRCKNNMQTVSVPVGSTLGEVYRESGLDMKYGPISAKVNNKVEGLQFRVYNNKDVEFLDMYSSSGQRAYTRTLFFVLCKAVHELYPEGEVMIDIPVSNGYYCDLRIGHDVTEADVEKIRTRMQDIVKAA
ncbi:MAG: nucleoside kinase, partial [Prevotella sp.]|nr:nucleoside kinase [Prevotella sp.]